MVANKPAKAVRKAVKATVESAAARVWPKLLPERETPPVPGTPGSGTPAVAEPTKPATRCRRSPTRPARSAVRRRVRPPTSTPRRRPAQGRFLTTAQGARLRDSDHSLKAGERGPTLLQDHHLREKITHFDHERIPERVVHARGAGAHGTFIGYGNARSVTKAGVPGQGRRDTGVRAVLDRARVTRVGGHGAGHPRVRDEVLHRRGHLRPGRQQHPGLLHPGRHQVPRRRSTPASRTRTGRSRRRRARTTRSGTSSPCTPRPSTTRSGTCPTAASPARTG